MLDHHAWQRVFVATDLQVDQADAFAHALRLVLARGGSATFAHVHRPETEVDWSPMPRVRDVLTQWGRLPEGASVDYFHRLGVRVELAALPSLDLLEPLVAEVQRLSPQLVMVPTHGRRGLERLREPSVAEAFARRVHAPTLFLPERARGFVDVDSGSVSLRRVLIPVSHADDTRRAIEAATTLVHSYDAAPAEFILVHVGDKAEVPPLFLTDDDPRWSWRVDVRHGPLERELVSAIDAHDVDVVVMATRGHDGLLDSLRGSHTEIVIRHAAVPVLSVPLS